MWPDRLLFLTPIESARSPQYGKQVTKTQIDRLGLRLKEGNITEADLRMLDDYRRSFIGAYEQVVRTTREQLGVEVTGRPAKSTTSIVEKLRRESIRLTQIQDIAGCRFVVNDVAAQDRIVESFKGLFRNLTIVDRRERPSYGYRAVHIIVNISGKPIEIQVRTPIQHKWAELSEKVSDILDPSIKYGGGNDALRTLLVRASNLIASVELSEKRVAAMLVRFPPRHKLPKELQQELDGLREDTISQKDEITRLLGDMIADLD